MRIVQVLNNNAVIAVPGSGPAGPAGERILVGRGVGFGRRPGQAVDPERVERSFVPQSTAQGQQLSALLAQIPFDEVAAVGRACAYIRARLPYGLGPSMDIALLDHVHAALDRHAHGLNVPNALLSELRSYQSEEYAVAVTALGVINQDLGVDLPEDEAGYIVLHIVNAATDVGKTASMSLARLVNAELQGAERSFAALLRPSSASYPRFLAHMRAMLRRYFTARQLHDHRSELFDLVAEQYPQDAEQARAFAADLADRHGRPVTDEEVFYLILHLSRLRAEAATDAV